jgi:biopolymer transport protein ExbD
MRFDMTPMIDVVLQLIIFFMYTSTFSEMVRTPVDLPEEPGEEIEKFNTDALVVDVRTDGTILVQGVVLTLEELRKIVGGELIRGGEGSHLEIVLRPDRDAPSSHINAIAGELASLGVRDWRIATVVPQGGVR